MEEVQKKLHTYVLLFVSKATTKCYEFHYHTLDFVVSECVIQFVRRFLLISTLFKHKSSSVRSSIPHKW